MFEVGALDLPADDDVASVATSASGRLFVQRAEAVHPRFVLDDANAAGVAAVCRRLDGLALAIELTASRVRVLTPDQIASRLSEAIDVPATTRGTPDRHQTMRSAIAWSYDLLTEAERRLFRRLAVFRTSLVLGAAEEVAEDLGQATVDVLGSLVDQSLVTTV